MWFTENKRCNEREMKDREGERGWERGRGRVRERERETEGERGGDSEGEREGKRETHEFSLTDNKRGNERNDVQSAL
jgi:hypothetical protein